MECISVFDMLKVGIGPSSSHTLGPWKAGLRFLGELRKTEKLERVTRVRVLLYGSLSLTGKGHATDLAVQMGLCGADPETVPIESVSSTISEIREKEELRLGGSHPVRFDPKTDISFHRKFLPFHANGLTFEAHFSDGKKRSETYYSIGGGFVVKKEQENAKRKKQAFNQFPYPSSTGAELLSHCKNAGASISDIVLENERSLRTDSEIGAGLQRIWEVMLASIYEGCHTPGELPGGLRVKRRAAEIYQNLQGDSPYTGPSDWPASIRNTRVQFRQILKWVSCFALSVNEVNASLGRIVTAPTNGSAGVIPAVLMYYLVIENHQAGFPEIKRFLLVAGEIGSLFKKGATISAAMGGCQAEIGVSSAMAAGALTELLGGTPAQVLMAAEIAMEHHLGLTCDPIAGLVQIPCIERNSMGAIKAINAAELALGSDAANAKVPFDKVVQTMWETARDMNSKYKETSEGGLAVGVNLSDC
ncbi:MULTISPECIES: L-serine ammonia-lyase [unclassified Robiginitalea]|mgnify:CR=1 FL=1|uniref:L-serine ammonia-lyase n=1 Tax=Robiginitalea TaxID=252306 RepID=UPI00234938D0|nr:MULTISPECIES: L-serine ammonia-lyase [unclassified Robiginitalea]MDC6354225.1 L-serine ammonia-lyase [Robiginitalea sp. PM2]MDC6374492.1 L-serine ammonia-lyase [Robiginitalea sp. SP8]